jgi:hypothetical protein
MAAHGQHQGTRWETLPEFFPFLRVLRVLSGEGVSQARALTVVSRTVAAVLRRHGAESDNESVIANFCSLRVYRVLRVDRGR